MSVRSYADMSDEDILREIVRDRLLDRLVALDESGSFYWAPHPDNKPQNMAYESEADELLYGGGAGGGKTDLLIGIGITQQKRGIIYRKQKVDHKGIRDRGNEILGPNSWSARDNAFLTPDGRQIELGHATTQRDLNSQQGRARDYNAFDELAQFTLAEYLWLTGWNRSADPNQRCRIVSGSNPPMTAEGQWIIERWGPWLDKRHPNPAKDGELRWYASINGKDTAVPDNRRFVLEPDDDGKPQRVYDFDAEKFEPHEIITPRSRTFIRAMLSDNPYYRNSGYRAVLQALPEPMRSAMLLGEFTAMMGSDPWQVIPTAWIEAAMDRWVDKPQGKRGPMDAMGVDPARGGLDNTVLAMRFGEWYAPLVSIPGKETDTGFKAISHVIQHLRDGAPVHTDVIGIGGAVVDAGNENGLAMVAIDVREATKATDRSGTLRFYNKRAELVWKFREALDPEMGDDVALPPDPELKADLAAPRYEVTARGIKIELKEEIKERLGRSPDKGDAVLLAYPNITMQRSGGRNKGGSARNPQPVDDADPRYS